ncbi:MULTISPECIES: DUF2586 family protein [unclassified Meiothermus]|uniref:DUF2586 family protein n=1 Tax=unclassified Meiothermus TaxID=370471 RepID=UPI000D7D116B|nr:MULTISPECIES: DUF2586 family protein [unclassified Meiothermus]PZA07790.1 hypothetical protein DNA98_05640 [Meiothermus sp. Pnk-1]RYM38908.1 DUF2586 family protein [Meiothermus sp. PNK-Is4]
MARLPGVYPEIQDGGLGIVAPAGDGQRVIVGVSSAGPVNQVVAVSDLGDVPSKLGTGPLARAVADQLAFGGGQVYAVRGSADVAGVVTPDAANPTTPAVTITGNPLDAYELVVTITKAGAIGTSAFTYSLDGGDTVSAQIATAATYTIPGTGLTLNCAVGNYVLDSVYKFNATAPKLSVSSAQAAIRAALNTNLLYEYIQLAQPSDAATWAALDALAVEAANNFRYIFFLAETVPPDAATDVDTWVNARLAEMASFSSKHVAVVAAYGEVVDTLTGRIEVQSLAARIGARLSASPVHVKASWVRPGPLPGVVEIAPFVISGTVKSTTFTNAHALALEQAGFTTVYKLEGLSGVFVVEDRMAAAPTSDFKVIANRRVVNKAVQQVRQALLPYVQQDQDPTAASATLKAMEADAQQSLNAMIARGEAVRATVVIPPGQDILATSQITIRVRIVPKGYSREIILDLGLENPFKTA